MKKVRLLYKKTGRAKYISHLDLMATMQRSLLRIGARLRYSEGFNPHPYLSVALPLPVGCSSICELMDIGLTDESEVTSLAECMTAAMPDGLEVTGAYEPNRKFNEIAWLEIIGKLFYEKGTTKGIAQKLNERFSAQRIIISKKTKRGLSDINIAPHIRGIVFSDDKDDGVIAMKALVSAQDPSINTDNLMSALDGEYKELQPDFSLFTRIEIFSKDMGIFR